ncbi:MULTISPECIES: hypothetical protein [Janthinobacterium]|uniref:hypothetical protein n=1 Tax=Janthinobacterium TaxID=29580 RepID=UPI001C5B3D6D|nr:MULTISPECIES: hypothetical protein [Janthinobacterium]MBW3512300.1 hypothetical protein [Janthinobacterium sp. NKUCC06_STL]MCA1860064.1 hypothetical protein [Janthinobacterium lividum]
MRTLLTKIRNTLAPQAGLPAAARMERLSDRRGLPAFDPGPQAVVKACTAWLCAAQDHSSSNDGGVARDYNLLTGWSSSYPETTGYIIPTMIALARRTGDHGEDEALHGRARRMLDWCVTIQFPEGGFQGGKIDSTPRVPVTFNTGQILLGLAAGVAAYGAAYEDALHRAASWLRDSQDADGCWRRHPTPFASAGDKAYETHVAWGLFEADRIAPGQGYGAAGLRQVDWALSKQRPNGWFASNCLDNPLLPLTHTIGYALRGLLEAHRFSARADLLDAAARTGTSIARAVAADGYLAGRLGPDFQPGASYACLTGSAQNAYCLFLLYQLTGERHYLDAGRRLNRYVRRSISIDGPAHARGGVKGSFPVDGDYGTWAYLNWAAKFCIDANLLEIQIGDA